MGKASLTYEGVKYALTNVLLGIASLVKIALKG